MQSIRKTWTPNETANIKPVRTVPPTDPGFLPEQYEQNGLFAKVVDMPAEDAALKGFDLEGISPQARSYFRRELERINWPEAASTALKWQRLFGGALLVVFADDGRGLEDPLDLERVRAVDGLQVFDSCTVSVDIDAEGEPVSFTLLSNRACCTVHPSRCLLFRSDPLPERATDPAREFWGASLYTRIERAIQDVLTAHGYAPKLLERMGGGVLKVPGLSELMSTAQGEKKALERVRQFDALRGLFSTLFIDTAEEYTAFPPLDTPSRIALVTRSTWEELSSVTSIPLTFLMGGRADMTEGEVIGQWKNADDKKDLEQYADYIRGIQEDSIKGPLLYLLKIIGRAGVAAGELRTVEPVRVKWKPIYPARGVEAADNDLKRAQVQRKRAETLAGQVAGGIITPKEARRIIKGKNRKAGQKWER